MLSPDYIFETSWEVCNRVGGIYAVLSTRAASMQKEHKDKVFFFGPDFGDHSDKFFQEDKTLLPEWDKPKNIRIGRWKVPGEPIAILLSFNHLWQKKNDIYAWAWNNFQVQSHAAYGDYDDSCMFGYAAGEVMHSLYDYLSKKASTPSSFVAHANEWQTAFALFYIRAFCPKVATLFTTHATGIGRSIAGNGKPLYDYFTSYNGDQMAQELNMVSKHSVEKQAAYYADCFTTVSDITARECAQLLDKQVDIVTPNGFEPNFVPHGRAFAKHRQQAREQLTRFAEEQLGRKIADNSLFCCISGRQEWKNKGIDVFLLSMDNLNQRLLRFQQPVGEVIAFVMIPYLDQPIVKKEKVTILFVPYYLDGHDPVFKCSYYDLLIGMDITAFPSYYEPWGYTPLESVAFHVPTITTNLAGFGLWAREEQQTRSRNEEMSVVVLDRTDSNMDEVADGVAATMSRYMMLNENEKQEVRVSAAAIAKKAEWRCFFKYYRQAYDIALRKVIDR